MGQIVLINDVHSQFDDTGFLVGCRDAQLTDEGTSQSFIIAQYLMKRFCPKNIITSDAVRLKQIIHHLRIGIKGATFRTTDALRERNFGVLAGMTPNLNSEIFTASRICAEQGESIAECRSRMLYAINKYDEAYPNDLNLFISHPYVCQIAENVLVGRDVTTLEGAWFKKGHMAVFDTLPHFELKESLNILETNDE